MALFVSKKNILLISVTIAFLTIMVRLFNVQIIEDKYRINAENNALKYKINYPARGRILDRNGGILVDNKLIYDIEVVPVDVKPFDTLALCKLFQIDESFVKERFEQYSRNRSLRYNSVSFLKQVSSEMYNNFAEKSYLFHGFDAVVRTARSYPINSGGNLLGYISEVDQDFLDNNEGYSMGDFAGKTGMEMAFEDRLKGEKGYDIYLRDVNNRILEPYEDGMYDKEAVEGIDVVSTIDMNLQAYGQHLMENKVGSVVAIEPATGEILAMVSSPGIDVSQLAEINKYYSTLITDPYKPMFNRAVQSAQPPGSVFKIVNGLIGLQEGVLTPETKYPCHSGYSVGKIKVGCHSHTSPIDMYQSLMMSCNAYYCYVFRDIIDNPKYESVSDAFDAWREYVMSFGFGTKLGTDIPYELAGNVPSRATYDKLHGENRWKSLSIISLAIGQGELGCTPLHLANLCATVANRGYYITPHYVKYNADGVVDSAYTIKHYTKVDPKYFPDVVEGMRRAVHGGPGGTARSVEIPGIEMCAKTGTAQNPHGDDHSVFICFAPKDNPKIAIAAYVENGGFGATWAAPIASLMVEKYLKGEISPDRQYMEQNMIESNLLNKVRVSR
ncbi:MAG: penicillin-binding protein 2 [Bacteroidales bacterium]|nr:penicillin-binding protein 2 [Bacteroidales bacterium]